MRFRSTSRRTPYLNRKDQRRLLWLVGLLAVVLIGMRIAANPRTWGWLFVGQPREEGTSEKTASSQTGRKSPGENLHPLRPHAFQAQSQKSQAAAAARTKTSPGEAIGKRAVTAHPPEEKHVAGDAPDDLALDPRLFEPIRDRELGVTFSELDSFYAVLRHVGTLEERLLRRGAHKEVAYTVLINNPELFRGSVLRLEGRLGSLKRLPKSHIQHGLGTLYEAWIVTPGSGSDPYRVVISELPAGLEPADLFNPPPPVRVTGYFFKIQKYEVERKAGKPRYHYAPLLLARRIELLRPAGLETGGLKLAPYVVGFALLIGGILAVTLWRFSVVDKRFAQTHLQRYSGNAGTSVDGLKNLPQTEDESAFFRRLSEESSAGNETN